MRQACTDRAFNSPGSLRLASSTAAGSAVRGSFVRPETARLSTSVSQAIGSTPLSFAVWISVIAMAQ